MGRTPRRGEQRTASVTLEARQRVEAATHVLQHEKHVRPLQSFARASNGGPECREPEPERPRRQYHINRPGPRGS